MTIRNPSFEDAGVLPGEAEHWTLVTSTARERIAGFGPEPYQAWEDFERWFVLQRAFGSGDVALGLFDASLGRAEGVEDFEEGWANKGFLRELPMGQVVVAVFGGRTVEDFDSGWRNAAFAMAWQEVAAVPAGIGPSGGSVESFESGWRENETYGRAWSAVGSESAMFGADAVETFESGWPLANTM